MSSCDFQAQLKSPLKSVGTHHYVHLDGFNLLPADATTRLVTAESLAQITRGDRYNVARFDNSHNRIALLNYPSFFEDAFPALHESWNVDLTSGRVNYRSYRDSLTPPILHRKELMLPQDHPRRAEFQALTEAAEAAPRSPDAWTGADKPYRTSAVRCRATTPPLVGAMLLQSFSS